MLINEKKYFLYTELFKIKDLLNANVYNSVDIYNWMKKYDFDHYAYAVLVSENEINKILSSDIEGYKK